MAILLVVVTLGASPKIFPAPHGASNSEAFCVGYVDFYIKALERTPSSPKNLPSIRLMHQELKAKVKTDGITYGEKLLYNEGFKAAKEAFAGNRHAVIDDTIRVCVGAKAHPSETEVNQIFYAAGMDSHFARECKLRIAEQTDIRAAFERYAKSTLIHQRYAVQRMRDFDKGVMDAKHLVLAKGFGFVLSSTGVTCGQLEKSLRDRLAVISKSTK